MGREEKRIWKDLEGKNMIKIHLNFKVVLGSKNIKNFKTKWLYVYVITQTAGSLRNMFPRLKLHAHSRLVLNLQQWGAAVNGFFWSHAKWFLQGSQESFPSFTRTENPHIKKRIIYDIFLLLNYQIDLWPFMPSVVWSERFSPIWSRHWESSSPHLSA